MRNVAKILITGSLILLLTGCGLTSAKNNKGTTSPTPIPPTPTPAETQLPEAERPVVTLTPDTKMQKVNVKITNLPKDVEEADMELVYFAGETERGQITTYYVKKAKNEILLGTCSSGTCSYDKDISNGSLTLTYTTKGKDVLLRYPFNP